MDFSSRDHYRHAVERLSHQSKMDEEEVARQVIELSKGAIKEQREQRASHVGFYLIGDGLEELKKKIDIRKGWNTRFREILANNTLFFYVGTILLCSLLGTLLFAHIAKGAGVPVEAYF